MTSSTRYHTGDCANARTLPSSFGPKNRAGFTILEVAMAASVMLLALSGALVVLTQGLRSIDTARNTAIANQVLQTFTEDLRTRTWAQITDTTVTGNISGGTIASFDLDQVNHYQSKSFTAAGSTAAAVMSRFTFSRSVTDVSGSGSTIKRITLSASWTGMDRQRHTITSVSYYAQNGLYAYYST